MRTLKILFLVQLIIIVMFASQVFAEEEYTLKVKIKEKILLLLEEEKEIKRYLIGVPKNDWLPLPLLGQVKRIEIDPWWYPTEKTRISYLKKRSINLSKAIPPHSCKNAMGKAKIIVEFTNFREPIRIHGTNNPNSIGQRVSRGCIRMHNEDIMELVQFIKNSKTKVIIE